MPEDGDPPDRLGPALAELVAALRAFESEARRHGRASEIEAVTAALDRAADRALQTRVILGPTPSDARVLALLSTVAHAVETHARRSWTPRTELADPLGAADHQLAECARIAVSGFLAGALSNARRHGAGAPAVARVRLDDQLEVSVGPITAPGLAPSAWVALADPAAGLVIGHGLRLTARLAREAGGELLAARVGTAVSVALRVPVAPTDHSEGSALAQRADAALATLREHGVTAPATEARAMLTGERRTRLASALERVHGAAHELYRVRHAG